MPVLVGTQASRSDAAVKLTSRVLRRGGQPKQGVDTGPLQLVEAGLLKDIEVSEAASVQMSTF